MRILHVIDSMDPARGGPVESILQSSTVIGELGHISEIVSLDSVDAPWNSRVPITHYPQGRLMRRYGYSPQFTRWLLKHSPNFDAVIIHGLWTYATLGAWQGLRHGSTPYVVFPHGMLDPWFGRAQPVKNIAKQVYWTLALGRVLSDAQAVLFTTVEEERLARTAFYGHRYRSQVVAYGTADIAGDKQAQIDSFYAAYPAAKNRSFLLFLGRIHPKKGCDLLIDAFARYTKAYPHIDLVIAGPDQIGWCDTLKSHAAERGISERIHWPGMLSGALKWGAFHAADAFILPSHQENFGIAVAEAMACSKPVLISDKVNIWPDIDRAGAGLVAPDDLAGTHDLLHPLLRPNSRNKSGDGCGRPAMLFGSLSNPGCGPRPPW